MSRRLTPDELADRIEARNALRRLDMMEAAQQRNLGDPNWRPWRASEMRGLRIVETAPDGSERVIFDKGQKNAPPPAAPATRHLNAWQADRVKRMREAGITVVGAP